MVLRYKAHPPMEPLDAPRNPRRQQADRALRVRSGMALAGVALICASSVVMLWLASRGWAPWEGVLWWCAIMVGGIVVQALLVCSGVSRYWRDPSLTMPQLLWGITGSATAYVLAGEAKGVVPGMLAVTLMFAGIDLKAKPIIQLMLYALLTHAAAIYASVRWGHTADPAIEIAYAVALLIVLGGCLLLSLRLYQLRAHLRHQRQALSDALAVNRELAMRDALTGLVNRRHMLELIELEQRRCLRGKRSMLLVQLDVDHFKQVNDRFGHAAGDRALQMIARVVGRNIRSSDVLARWGGEEFVMLLSDAKLSGALGTLERVRQAVERDPVEGVESTAGLLGGLFVTVSMGVAEHVVGETAQQTLERADQALYQAKRAGRNQVVVAPSPLLTPPERAAGSTTADMA